jgi:hypothetical protein
MQPLAGGSRTTLRTRLDEHKDRYVSNCVPKQSVVYQPALTLQIVYFVLSSEHINWTVLLDFVVARSPGPRDHLLVPWRLLYQRTSATRHSHHLHLDRAICLPAFLWVRVSKLSLSLAH